MNSRLVLRYDDFVYQETRQPATSKPPLESSRKRDFASITKALVPVIRAHSKRAILAEGDSLGLLRSIPSHTISLILTDPPYHSTKKENICGDTAFQEDQHYLDWMAKYAIEWKRILRPTDLCFAVVLPKCPRASKFFSARISTFWRMSFGQSRMRPGFDGWKQKMKKEALRQWYAHTERLIFGEPACEGNMHRSPFAHFLKETRKKTGMSTHDLAEVIGAYGRVNHGGSVSNWEAGRNIPSREQYAKMCDALIATGKIQTMPRYEDVVRPFIIDGTKEFTDVWTFPSVRPYKGKHPAEKPSSLLEHAIEATTFPGDIVLDCFAGSGSTALAAIKLGRLSVSMEIDPLWVSSIAERLQLEDEMYIEGRERDLAINLPKERRAPQLPLFSAT